jgi:hypothetical protein
MIPTSRLRGSLNILKEIIEDRITTFVFKSYTFSHGPLVLQVDVGKV